MLKQGEKIWINTKNPERFQKLYQKTIKNYLASTEKKINLHLENVIRESENIMATDLKAQSLLDQI